jgi:hypothetical protein
VVEKFYRFLGEEFTLAVPCLDRKQLTLNGIANLIADRAANIYRRGADGAAPAMQTQPPFRNDSHWRDLLLFHEYFHAGNCHGNLALAETKVRMTWLVFKPLSPHASSATLRLRGRGACCGKQDGVER